MGIDALLICETCGVRKVSSNWRGRRKKSCNFCVETWHRTPWREDRSQELPNKNTTGNSEVCDGMTWHVVDPKILKKAEQWEDQHQLYFESNVSHRVVEDTHRVLTILNQEYFRLSKQPLQQNVTQHQEKLKKVKFAKKEGRYLSVKQKVFLKINRNDLKKPDHLFADY
tara:strand:- start:1201 stop:1707 length:507 start_codon:yes stop_codon:yes gene_type:complete